MSRIIEQVSQSTINDADMFLMDHATNGSHAISGKDLKASIMSSFDPGIAPHSAGFHNSIYRGKNLGTTITSEQKAVIDNGLFTDLFVGDYWTLNGRVYRIADFDTFYQCGDNMSANHHVALVPDASFGNRQMAYTESGSYQEGSANTTYGGYIGSYFRTGIPYGESEVVADGSSWTWMNNIVQTDLTNSASAVAIYSYRDMLPGNGTNAAGADSTRTWTDCAVELMDETMVYGARQYSGNVAATGCCQRQLSLFRLNPAMLHTRYYYWLRNTNSSAYFCRVNDGGFAGYYYASDTFGVRPLVLVR